jgi:hypothetical protein
MPPKLRLKERSRSPLEIAAQPRHMFSIHSERASSIPRRGSGKGGRLAANPLQMQPAPMGGWVRIAAECRARARERHNHGGKILLQMQQTGKSGLNRWL